MPPVTLADAFADRPDSLNARAGRSVAFATVACATPRTGWYAPSPRRADIASSAAPEPLRADCTWDEETAHSGQAGTEQALSSAVGVLGRPDWYQRDQVRRFDV